MDTKEDKVLFRDEVFQIVGRAIEVLNTLGHGLVEKPYENALVVELGLRKIPFRQQPDVRCPLQKPQDWPIHSRSDRLRFDRCRYKGN